ncbi:MAG: asparagine synthase (glutamine-hydrolyzing) [Microthrixaceae bacterium]
MCGITGFIDSRSGAASAELERAVTAMADTLAHRGPDDHATWVDPEVGVALGFRRLSIVDLSPTGRQPMTSADGRYVLVFNGETYNHVALRAELEGAGVVFRGTSDTEVLLEAIARWGFRPALERANGMFALACWDRRERRLHLARDRFGEKPLYYGWCGKTFVFASELKALRAHPAFVADVDRDALTLYFRYAYVPAPRSIYRGIAKLPPACTVTVDPERQSETSAAEPYWSPVDVALESARRPPLAQAAAVETVEAAVRASVGLRMVADVPVGAFLSGGTDSSVVVALMQAQSERPVRTFTIGFPKEGYDEAARARAVASHLGTDHTELYLTPEETQATVPRLPAMFDEPFADSSQIPTLLVSELARRDVTVALSGDGGDELFAGYTRYPAFARLQRWNRVPAGARHALASALRSQPPDRWDRDVAAAARLAPGRAAPAQPGDKLHKLARALDVDEPAHLYRSLVECWATPPVIGAREPATIVDRAADWQLSSGPEQAMLVDTVSYLPDDLLTKVDRASMAVSLEARVPMLDPAVYAAAWRLPPSYRASNGTGKRVLTDILRRHLPTSLVGGPKVGFGVPFGDWLRGPLRPWAEALLDERRLRTAGYLDAGAVQAAWREHCTGRRDRRHELWAVLMFEAWLDSLA